MHIHLSGVAFHVHCVGLGCHVVIGVGRLVVRFHHAYVIPSFLHVVVRLYLVIVNSNCSHNNCLLHIAKTGHLRCCLYNGEYIIPLSLSDRRNWWRKCTHTPCGTHIFFALLHCVTYRHEHTWLKVFAVRMSHLSLPPSPFSCFIRRPCCSRTVTSTPRSRLHLPCRTVPDPKARVKRTSARADEEFGYLTDPTNSTGCELQRVRQDYFCRRRHDAYQRSEPRLHLWLLKNHTREHWTVRCFHNVRSLCVDTFLMVSFLFKEESKESMLRETVARHRETEKKEKVLWSVLQSRCQGKVDGTVLGVILFRLTENSFLMNEISQKTWNEELNKLFLVKIQFRENNIHWMSTTWRSKIQSEEIQNTYWSESQRELESQRRQLLKVNQ